MTIYSCGHDYEGNIVSEESPSLLPHEREYVSSGQCSRCSKILADSGIDPLSPVPPHVWPTYGGIVRGSIAIPDDINKMPPW